MHMYGRMAVGSDARLLRETCGLTREHAARECGVSQRMIQGVELGTHQPSLELALRMAKAYRCKIDDFTVAFDTTEPAEVSQ